MYAEAVGRAALPELSEEDYLLAHFLYGNVEVFHAREYALEVVELMIVRGKQRLGALSVFMDVLHDAAGNGHAIVGGCSAAYLVQKHQRPGAEVVKYHCRFQHLHHERGFSAGNVVRRPYACEYLVKIAYMGFLCRNEGPALGHEHYQSRLPKERALTCHVGTREDDNLLAFCIKIDVVGHVFLPGGHQGFNYGMAALLYVEYLGIIYFRAAVMHLDSLFGESGQHIQLGKDAAVCLDIRNVFLDLADKLRENPLLYCKDLVFGGKDFFLVFLELFRDITLCVYKGLLADPLRRHLVLVGVTHLYIIAENIVVGYFKGTYAGSFGLTLLHLKKVVLAAGAEVS